LENAGFIEFINDSTQLIKGQYPKRTPSS